MRAYKFLSAGRVGLFSGVRWPEPGTWLTVDEGLVECVSGVHAVGTGSMLSWLDEELWVVELGGTIEQGDGTLVAERGRLVQRVEDWDERTASDFASACVIRARVHAGAALHRAGLPEAGELDRLEPDELAVRAVELADGLPDQLRSAVLLAADAVALARGRRPEEYAVFDRADGSPSPAAIAGNLAFVVAHAAGVTDPDGYDAGVAAERAWQLGWLRERLRLPDDDSAPCRSR